MVVRPWLLVDVSGILFILLFIFLQPFFGFFNTYATYVFRGRSFPVMIERVIWVIFIIHPSEIQIIKIIDFRSIIISYTNVTKCFYIFTNLLDRKSTRLNSSHVRISYAVFCLKKKKKK